MRKTAALAILGLSALPALAAPPPAPRIVVLDKVAILQASKVGQDVARQVKAAAEQAKNDLTAQGRALQNEGRTLQQQVAILAPDLKAKRLAAFQAKEDALKNLAQRKDDQLKSAFLQARVAIEQQLGPILSQVMKDHGANLVLDKQAVVMANEGGFDITGDVIAQLNQKMPSYKVNMNAPVQPQN